MKQSQTIGYSALLVLILCLIPTSDGFLERNRKEFLTNDRNFFGNTWRNSLRRDTNVPAGIANKHVVRQLRYREAETLAERRNIREMNERMNERLSVDTIRDARLFDQSQNRERIRQDRDHSDNRNSRQVVTDSRRSRDIRSADREMAAFQERSYDRRDSRLALERSAERRENRVPHERRVDSRFSNDRSRESYKPNICSSRVVHEHSVDRRDSRSPNGEIRKIVLRERREVRLGRGSVRNSPDILSRENSQSDIDTIRRNRIIDQSRVTTDRQSRTDRRISLGSRSEDQSRERVIRSTTRRFKNKSEITEARQAVGNTYQIRLNDKSRDAQVDTSRRSRSIDHSRLMANRDVMNSRNVRRSIRSPTQRALSRERAANVRDIREVQEIRTTNQPDRQLRERENIANDRVRRVSQFRVQQKESVDTRRNIRQILDKNVRNILNMRTEQKNIRSLLSRTNPRGLLSIDENNNDGHLRLERAEEQLITAPNRKQRDGDNERKLASSLRNFTPIDYVTPDKSSMIMNGLKLLLVTILIAQIVKNSSKTKGYWFNSLNNFVTVTKEKVL